MFKRINKLRIIAIIGIVGIAILMFYFFDKSQKQILGLNTLAISEIESYIPADYINIGQPRRLINLPNGEMWYIDTLNFRIVKLNPQGEIIRTVGRQGENEGEFNDYLTDITVDTDGNLYVQASAQTYKLDSNGGYIIGWNINSNFSIFGSANHYDNATNTLIIGDNSLVKLTTNGDMVFEFGNSGDGQVQNVKKIVTDTDGNIYALDTTAHNIKVYNPTGVFQYSIGSYGSADGQFMEPQGLAIKPNGELVVTCAHSNKIQEFASDGTFIRSWIDTDLANPYGISIDSEGNYFLSDIARVSIRKYSSNRVFTLELRNSGLTDGRFSFPTDLDYDSTGNLYVLENTGRVQKFTNTGTYIDTIIETGLLDNPPIITIHNDEIYITDFGSVRKFDLSGQQLLAFGTVGTGDGEFSGACGIDVDSDGNIYVADVINHRIQKFDSTGAYITQWGSLGSENDQFGSLNFDLIIDSNNNIYVADNPFYIADPEQMFLNTRIQVFDTDGAYLRTIGGRYTDTFDGTFVTVSGMTFDSEGNLNVLSFYHTAVDSRIQKFDPNTGAFISSYASGGSGVAEFNMPNGIALNPLTDTLSIADTWNHRILAGASGTRIFNLISSADVLSTTDQESLVNRYYDPLSPGIDNVSSRLYFGDYIISDFNVNLTEDRDWGNVNVNILPNDSKSLININPANAPGVSDTHSIYIVKQPGQTYVHMCPDAVLIEEVTMTCSNGYDLVEGVDDELSTVTIDGVEYWKVTGLN